MTPNASVARISKSYDQKQFYFEYTGYELVPVIDSIIIFVLDTVDHFVHEVKQLD